MDVELAALDKALLTPEKCAELFTKMGKERFRVLRERHTTGEMPSRSASRFHTFVARRGGPSTREGYADSGEVR